MSDAPGLAPGLLLMFSVDIDEKRLIFDPSDADADGLPDSIVVNAPADHLVVVLYDPVFKNRELAFLIIDTEAPFRPLPGAFISISLRTNDQNGGCSRRRFPRPSPPDRRRSGRIPTL